MRLLLDTHVLVWAFVEPTRIPRGTRELIADEANAVIFSAVALWEIAIKRALERPDFDVDPRVLHGELLDNGYEELVVTARHGMAVQALPLLHRDPFDRLLIAQAMVEGVTLLTADRQVLQYGQPTRAV